MNRLEMPNISFRKQIEETGQYVDTNGTYLAKVLVEYETDKRMTPHILNELIDEGKVELNRCLYPDFPNDPLVLILSKKENA